MAYDVRTTVMVFMLSPKNCPQSQKGSNTSSEDFVDEERWAWFVSLQTQYYSTCRRILLVNPVILYIYVKPRTETWLWRYV